MPHEIDSMAYSGEVPWHRLGKAVPDLQTGAEMVKAAGLDWTVELRSIYFVKAATPDSGIGYREVPLRFATVRTDREVALGVVGPAYRVLQNREAFSLADNTLDDSGAKYETAGALRGGRRVWALARLPQDILIAGKDAVRPYLLIHNSHDGSSGVTVALTPIRVVCWNTLTAALGSAERSFVIRHTSGMTTRFHQAREALGITYRYFEGFEALANTLVDTTFSDADVRALIERLFPIKKDAERSPKQTTRARDTVLGLYAHSENIAPYRGTAWAAYNALVEYQDHHRPTHNSPERDSIRLERAWFDPVGWKQDALDTILRMKGIKATA